MESHVFSWSRFSKLMESGVGFLKLLESGVGFLKLLKSGVGFLKLLESESGVGTFVAITDSNVY